ncbi:MAG: DUF6985 domain-containing protein [Bacteroidota bacterium]
MNKAHNIMQGTITGDRYETKIMLQAWASFQSRQGSYGARDTGEPSSGLVKLQIEGVETGDNRIISAAQVRAVNFLIENDTLIRDSLLAGVLAKFPELKDIYEKYLPELTEATQLSEHIGLTYLHIMPAEKDNHAYIGFEMGCTWDEEHGVGVMMHKDRVVSTGLADTAFNHWVTYEDNGTIEEEEKRWEEANKQLRPVLQKRKPWWKLW